MTPAQIQNIITAMNMSPGDREIFGTAPCNLKSNDDINRKTELEEEFKCRQFAEEDGKSWQHWHLIRECYRTYHKSFSRIRCTNCGKIIPGGRLFGFEGECEPCQEKREKATPRFDGEAYTRNLREANRKYYRDRVSWGLAEV